MVAIPQFQTERLILRAVEAKDVPSYQRNINDYAIIRNFVSTCPWPYPDDGVQTYLDGLKDKLGKTHWLWGLFLHDAPDEVIGAPLRQHPAQGRILINHVVFEGPDYVQGDHRDHGIAHIFMHLIKNLPQIGIFIQ